MPQNCELRPSRICPSSIDTNISRKTNGDEFCFNAFECFKQFNLKRISRLSDLKSKSKKRWGPPRHQLNAGLNRRTNSFVGITMFFLVISFWAFISPCTYAAEVTLTWRANDPNPDGYNLYARTEDESYDFNHPTWTGNTKSVVMQNLVDDVTYYFIVRSFQGDNESNNSNELNYTPRSNSNDGDSNANTVIVDDDDTTTSTGRWYISAGKDPYAGQSFYSLEPGATFKYTSQISGFFEVAIWWSYFGNRCSNVPVKIYDGDTVIDTVYINQRENSGQWYVIGSYNFSGQASAEVIVQNSQCSTCADAVEFSKY